METRKVDPYFTIVIPIYNVEKYLDRCINSILEQDFVDYEIILVDDGSPDKCPEICDEWCTKDERIRVIHKKNAGLGMARNTGIENANGKYIFFIDSDDYVLPGLLNDVYENIQETESEAVFYGFQRVDAEGNVNFRLSPNPDKTVYDNPEEISEKIFPYFLSRDLYTGKTFNLRISAWSCCLSVKMLMDNKLKFVSEREYISEDVYFYIEMFKCLSKISFLCKEYYCYCQNEGSLTFSYSSERFERIKKFYLDIVALGEKLGYDSSINVRFQNYFIATTMSCLKMEAANAKTVGIISTYKSFRRICRDDVFGEVISAYPVNVQNNKWKLFVKALKRKQALLLFAVSLVQYYKKGI